ncbi:hypothetical protein [Sporomusa sp. GT1]|uniref:hypothetical protein n=1 Tax=Sporomusa sp. GT1 TaxID=1534747 RepID=UPI001CB86D5D|nr:hypothetical protein [Sporomusa sp. GT1]
MEEYEFMERISQRVEAWFNHDNRFSMVTPRNSPEYLQKETKLCDKIREASDEVARLNKAGIDTTEALWQLEMALSELWRFKGKTFIP